MGASVSTVGPRQRRIWRLAFLLTGDAMAAAEIVQRVVGTGAEFTAMELPRLDRLVILHAREAGRPRRLAPEADAPALPVPAGPGAEASAAALALPRQALEAWILSRIDGVDELWMSRAMDCSRTAAARFLEAADVHMRARLGERLTGATEALRAFADGLDPARFIVAYRQSYSRHWRRRALVVIGMASILILAAALVALRILAGAR